MFSLLTAHPCIHVDVKIKFSFYPSYMNPDKFNASDGNIDLQYSYFVTTPRDRKCLYKHFRLKSENDTFYDVRNLPFD